MKKYGIFNYQIHPYYHLRTCLAQFDTADHASKISEMMMRDDKSLNLVVLELKNCAGVDSLYDDEIDQKAISLCRGLEGAFYDIAKEICIEAITTERGNCFAARMDNLIELYSVEAIEDYLAALKEDTSAKAA